MDNNRFDALTRTIAGKRSRRGMLAAAAGAVLVAAGLRRDAGAQLLPIGWPNGLICGGIAGLQCPPGYACDVDWSNCSADCMGICRRDSGVPTNPCAAITCAVGNTCCPNCGGICVAGGTQCSDELCAPAQEQCGPTLCAAGEVCCNASCGVCTPPDGACTQQFCVSETCGPNVCGLGEYCCNESCGICAPLGGSCTEQFCESGPVCGSVTCSSSEYCCNESCSICAPIDGGACTRQLCVPELPREVCGPTLCEVGEVCCNESCGICTPPDGFCTLQFCI